MKRKFSMITALGLLFTAMPMQASAYHVPDTVRVGLESVCKNASSASVGAGTLLIGEEKDGMFAEGGMVESNSNYTVRPEGGQLIILTEEMNCEEALELAEDLTHMGLDATAGYLEGEDWTVYIKGSSLPEIEEEAMLSAQRITGFEGIRLTGDVSVILPEEAVFMEENGHTSVNGKPYRGMMTFDFNEYLLTAVNVVDLEEYLYGVVPSEMPQSYEMEALKAQAVAARTYAMTKLNAHGGTSYQLCDTISCQVYKGFSNEAARTTEAIEATTGEVACYDGAPIEAVFCASMGGYTENTENVWNAPIPYLRAVPEFGEYGDSTWTRTITLDQLTAAAQAKGAGIGTATDIVITKLSSGGRVQELQIVGTNGTKILTKEAIRSFFSSTGSSLPSKLFTINGKGGDIGTSDVSIAEPVQKNKNTLLAAALENGIIARTEGTLEHMNGDRLAIEIETEQEEPEKEAISSAGEYVEKTVSISTVKNGKFVFEGKGNGHGVGLSQNGAQAMAQQGYSYEEILKHYYTGITIEG